MKILLTGSTGFIGRHLVPRLIQEHDIYIVTTNPDKAKALFGNKVILFHYNKDQQNLIDFIKKVKAEAVIHLASYITSSDRFNDVEKLIDVNINFLVSLLDAIKSFPPQLFVNTGTFAEYLNNDENFDPAYVYAATKTASRSFLKYYSNAYNFKFITLVPYSIYGENDSQKKLIDYLIDSAEKPIDFSAGEQILDFIHVQDVVNAYNSVLKNLNKIKNNETFYIGTGQGTSIRELAKVIEKQMGKKLHIRWGAKEYRKRDVMVAVAPIEKNSAIINWNYKIDVSEGLRLLIKEL